MRGGGGEGSREQLVERREGGEKSGKGGRDRGGKGKRAAGKGERESIERRADRGE